MKLIKENIKEVFFTRILVMISLKTKEYAKQ